MQAAHAATAPRASFYALCPTALYCCVLHCTAQCTENIDFLAAHELRMPSAEVGDEPPFLTHSPSVPLLHTHTHTMWVWKIGSCTLRIVPT